MKKSHFAFQLLTLFFSMSAFGSPAFDDPRYEVVSNDPLHEGEMTAFYEYPKDPCGSLMTEFSKPGSVRLG